jgi:DNA/RNA endonuclease G (NUC1)
MKFKYNILLLFIIKSMINTKTFIQSLIKIIPIHNEFLLKNKILTISYNTSLQSMNYGIYKLTNSCETKKSKSTYIKNKIPYGKLQLPYNNGHMIPKKDISNNITNNMINIVAQYGSFNNGIWNRLENFIRKNYKEYDILTVPDYDLNNFIKIDNNSIYIPVGFSKIIIKNNFVYDNYYIPHRINIINKDLQIYKSDVFPYFIKFL